MVTLFPYSFDFLDAPVQGTNNMDFGKRSKQTGRQLIVYVFSAVCAEKGNFLHVSKVGSLVEKERLCPKAGKGGILVWDVCWDDILWDKFDKVFHAQTSQHTVGFLILAIPYSGTSATCATKKLHFRDL